VGFIGLEPAPADWIKAHGDGFEPWATSSSQERILYGSIFFDFTLPNTATWFYFSFLLALAVFFKFDRLFSLRNWDVITLFLLVPGLLLLREAHAFQGVVPADYREAYEKSGLGMDNRVPDYDAYLDYSRGLLTIGYIWLVAGTAYLFARCVFDLGLEKRPSLTVNMNQQGLVWLGTAMFLSLSAVAIIRLPDAPAQVGRGPVALSRVQDEAIAVVSYQTGYADWNQATASFWATRFVAIGLHLTVVIALFLIGKRHFRDSITGVAMGCLYLMLPYTGYHVSQVHHVWPVVFILWALYAYRRPAAAGAWLGVAAGTAFFPFLLFPLWFGFYRGRGAVRFAFGFIVASGLSLGIAAALLLYSGEFRQYLNVTLSLSDWQAWKPPQTEGLWHGSHWAYRLPVFIAYMAFIVLTMFWPTPRNFGQVIAQSAAVVIGIQFWYADQGGVYVLWYLPLVLLMVFRPTLVDVRPPIPPPETKGVVGKVQQFVERARRFGRPKKREPQPA